MASLLLQKTDAEMGQKRTFEPDVKAVEDLLEDSWNSKQEENRLEEVKMEPEVAREVTPWRDNVRVTATQRSCGMCSCGSGGK